MTLFKTPSHGGQKIGSPAATIFSLRSKRATKQGVFICWDIQSLQFIIGDDRKIMIGGGCMSDVAKYVEADAYGEDAVADDNLIRRWLGIYELL